MAAGSHASTRTAEISIEAIMPFVGVLMYNSRCNTLTDWAFRQVQTKYRSWGLGCANSHFLGRIFRLALGALGRGRWVALDRKLGIISMMVPTGQYVERKPVEIWARVKPLLKGTVGTPAQISAGFCLEGKMDDHKLPESWMRLSESLRIRLDRLPPDECYYCGAAIDENPSKEYPWPLKKHIDHIYPKSKGGTDDLENLVPACIDCNRTKYTMTPDEWQMFCFVDVVAALRRLKWLVPDHILKTIDELLDIYMDWPSLKGVQDVSKSNGRGMGLGSQTD